MSLTDPQNDKPCRDCGAPTQHATERCDDCRTPAGRLVTALAALGIKTTPIDSFDVVVDKITVSADHLSWCLLCDDDTNDHPHNIEAAANAIAAIVQAPGLRAELDDIRAVLIDQGARPKEFLPPHAERTTLDMLEGMMDAGNQTAQEFMDLQREHAKERGALIIERDTLAAGNARLRSALYQAKVAARFPDASDAWDQVRDAVSVLDEAIGGVHPAQGEVSDGT